MVSAVDDPRYAVYAANEQRVLRSGLLVLVLISTLMSMAIIVVNAKDYFALKNVCCVGNYGPCASFLIRSSFGVIFSSITLYVGSGQIFVDTDIFTLVTGLLCIVMSFFALVFSLLSLHMRLTTNRHLIILQERKTKQRIEIMNATNEETKSTPNLYEMFS